MAQNKMDQLIALPWFMGTPLSSGWGEAVTLQQGRWRTALCRHCSASSDEEWVREADCSQQPKEHWQGGSPSRSGTKMAQGQETSVLKAQGSGHMDTGEPRASRALSGSAAGTGTCAMAFAVLDKPPGHRHWEDEPEQLCTRAEKWDIQSHVSGWASSGLCEVSLPPPQPNRGFWHTTSTGRESYTQALETIHTYIYYF